MPILFLVNGCGKGSSSKKKRDDKDIIATGKISKGAKEKVNKTPDRNERKYLFFAKLVSLSIATGLIFCYFN